MKRIPLIALLLLFAAAVYSQSWVSNAILKQLYTSPDSTRVGIGILNPSERLHVNKGALKIGNSSWAADRAVNMIPLKMILHPIIMDMCITFQEIPIIHGEL